MILPTEIRFASEKLKSEYNSLKITDRELYEWLTHAFEIISSNAHCGIQLPKRLIPNEYKHKYQTRSLWKYNLPKGWRLIYSIENEKIIVVSIILEWFDHKGYERRFKY